MSSLRLSRPIDPQRVFNLLVAYLPREGEYAADTVTWAAAILKARKEGSEAEVGLLDNFGITTKPDCLPHSSVIDTWLTRLYAMRSPSGPISHRVGSRVWITFGPEFQDGLRAKNEPEVPPEIIPVIKGLAKKIAPLVTDPKFRRELSTI